MKLSEIKTKLALLEKIAFQLPDGTLVPKHFHVTEIGKITKHFIDCGGTVRNEEVVNFQLWNANDYDHRLHPEKLLKIIDLSEKTLNITDNLNVEVEYQGKSIEKYGIEFNGKHFLLTTKQTDCLAKEKCNISNKKQHIQLSNSQKEPCCVPNSNCC